MSGILARLLAAVAIGYVLLTASRILETMQLFLFTSPSSPDADIRIVVAVNSSAVTLMRALFIFSAAGFIGAVSSRDNPLDCPTHSQLDLDIFRS